MTRQSDGASATSGRSRANTAVVRAGNLGTNLGPTRGREWAVTDWSRTLGAMSVPASERLSAPRVLSHLVVMVAVAAVLGVVVAGLAIPFAGVARRRRPQRRRGRWTTCPSRAQDRPAAAADHDRSTPTATVIATLYDENRDQRPARPDLADHGQGDRRDRGLPLLPARRPRPEGHAARARHQPGQQRRGPGWLVDHPADGQADAAQPGQDQGRARRPRPTTPTRASSSELRYAIAFEQTLLQGLDPRALPQHRLLRRRRLRRPGGRPALLRRQRQRPQPAPVRDAGRPGEEPRPATTRPTTPTGPSSAATSSSTGWPSST